jgi:hypothetical protein
LRSRFIAGEVLERITLAACPGMARDVALRHEAAERLAEHDGPGDAQRVAEAHDVVGEGVERPLLGRATVAAAMAAVVVVDDLRDVGQAREQRLEAGVVVAGAAVEEDEGGLFAEGRAVGDEGGTFDVDEETEVGGDGDSHDRRLAPKVNIAEIPTRRFGP